MNFGRQTGLEVAQRQVLPRPASCAVRGEDVARLTAKELAAAFKMIGFPRSVQWIAKKRLEIMVAERRVGL